MIETSLKRPNPNDQDNLESNKRPRIEEDPKNQVIMKPEVLQLSTVILTGLANLQWNGRFPQLGNSEQESCNMCIMHIKQELASNKGVTKITGLVIERLLQCMYEKECDPNFLIPIASLANSCSSYYFKFNNHEFSMIPNRMLDQLARYSDYLKNIIIYSKDFKVNLNNPLRNFISLNFDKIDFLNFLEFIANSNFRKQEKNKMSPQALVEWSIEHHAAEENTVTNFPNLMRYAHLAAALGLQKVVDSILSRINEIVFNLFCSDRRNKCWRAFPNNLQDAIFQTALDLWIFYQDLPIGEIDIKENLGSIFGSYLSKNNKKEIINLLCEAKIETLNLYRKNINKISKIKTLKTLILNDPGNCEDLKKLKISNLTIFMYDFSSSNVYSCLPKTLTSLKINDISQKTTLEEFEKICDMNLTSLSLSFSNRNKTLEKSLIEKISTMKTLNHLEFINAQLTDEAAKTLFESLASLDLSSLNLINTVVPLPDLKMFLQHSNSKGLRDLSLGFLSKFGGLDKNFVVDEELIEIISKLPYLSSLKAYNTKIDKKSFEILSNMPKLNLFKTDVTSQFFGKIKLCFQGAEDIKYFLNQLNHFEDFSTDKPCLGTFIEKFKEDKFL